MSQQESATQNAMADQIAAPAPANEEVVPVQQDEIPAVNEADPAPAEALEEEVQKPEQSKAVKELIAQRKKRQQAEQEAAYWRGVAESAVKKEQAEPQQAQQNPDGAPVEPDPNRFTNYDAYERAKDKYLVELAKHQIKLELRADGEKQKQQVLQTSFQQKLETAMAVDDELSEIVHDKTLPISPTMLRVIQESENSVELLKWLGSNRQEAAKLYSMDPVAVTRELVRAEAKFNAKATAEPPKKVSQAPAPIQTVAPIGSVNEDEGDLPIEEYHRRRTKAMFGR